MRHLIFIMFFISLIPTVFAENTISNIDSHWTLTGYLTNTNPYTVFVAVPDNITYSQKTLKSSDDFLKVSLDDNSPSINISTSHTTVLNGKKGFWMPPYTTVKIKMRGVIDYTISTDGSQNGYDVSGPALVDSVKVMDLKTIFPIYKKGVKFDNFRLYVRGSLTKSDNIDTLSLIMPAPLVIKNYYKFDKVIGTHDIDVWTDSYNKYVNKHKKLKYKQNSELYNIDDALVPKMDNDFGMDIKLKTFDVPAMVFTTSSSEPIDYGYVMYWDNKYN